MSANESDLSKLHDGTRISSFGSLHQSLEVTSQAPVTSPRLEIEATKDALSQHETVIEHQVITRAQTDVVEHGSESPLSSLLSEASSSSADMAARNRPRNGGFKEDSADAHEEKSMWEQLQRDLRKCAQIQNKQKENSIKIQEMEVTIGKSESLYFLSELLMYELVIRTSYGHVACNEAANQKCRVSSPPRFVGCARSHRSHNLQVGPCLV